MDLKGESKLILHFQPAESSVSVEPYEWISMIRACHSREVEFLNTFSRWFKKEGFRGVRRVAVDGAWFSNGLATLLRKTFSKIEIVNITADLIRMRQQKDEDEVAAIRKSIALIEVAYQRAKEVIQVDKTELEIYQELSAAIDHTAGEHVELKGDFACGLRGWKEGGMPTSRRIQKGDLYILDLFPELNGYYGDLSRVFAVGPLNRAQKLAWDLIVETQKAAEKIIEPGIPGRVVYEFVRKRLARYKASKVVFPHHAGHGIGLNHEHPRLTPKSDERIVEGSVFTLEPGLYGEELQGGLRIEHNYWLTANGLERLDHFPVEPLR